MQNVQLLCLHGSTQTDFTEECEDKLDYFEFKVKENCTEEWLLIQDLQSVLELEVYSIMIYKLTAC